MRGIVSFVDTDDVFEQADPKDLPDYTPTADEYGSPHINICGHLYQLLLLWRQGGCQPVTFGDLRAHSTGAAEVPQLVRKLLGAGLWDGWF